MASEWSQEVYIRTYRFAAKAHWNSDNKQLLPGTDIPYLMHFSLVAMEVIAALEKEAFETFNLQSAVFNTEGIRITNSKDFSNDLCPSMECRAGVFPIRDR